MRTILWENLVKNSILIILLVIAYPITQNSFSDSNLVLDKPLAGNLLVAISILAVTACFGCFAFTYEKVNHKDATARFLAHLTTALLMLLIGLSLEMTAILTRISIGSLPVFEFCLALLYLTIVLYDFWDLKRAEL